VTCAKDHLKSARPYARSEHCAADMAKLLDIHVSTAKKYLDLFFNCDFLERQVISNKPGKPTYFYPKSSQITITLDMNYIARSLTTNLDEGSLTDPLIRQRLDPELGVTYDIGSDRIYRKITVKKRTKARRFVKQKLELSRTEGQFMKYLPHPTMEHDSFLQVCKDAGIVDYYEIKSLHFFVKKLEKLGIVEIKKALEKK